MEDNNKKSIGVIYGTEIEVFRTEGGMVTVKESDKQKVKELFALSELDNRAIYQGTTVIIDTKKGVLGSAYMKNKITENLGFMTVNPYIEINNTNT